MARAATRSQRTPKASQSQPRPSQSQRRVDSDDEEMEDARSDDAMDVDGQEEGSGDADTKRKASALVRLALFTEHKRAALRREDINKKVMGSNSRSFQRVFEAAQAILRQTFGMELVELQSKAALEKERAGIDEEALEENRKATATKKKATVAGSKTYILRSTLDPLIVEHASQSQLEILDQEHTDRDEEDENETLPQAYGSILSWSTCDQLEPIGILYVILTLILVSGRVISDSELRSHLKRLHLSSDAGVNFDVKSTTPNNTQDLDQFLGILQRQGYIEQHTVGEVKKGKGGGGKRVRSQADNDSGIKYEWRWGVRAYSEVGEKGIAQFAAEFMVTREHEEDEDEDEGQGARNRNRNRRGPNPHEQVEKMLGAIEKAAGSELVELK
ncbi:hypothetical protein D9758_006135 [Tetrapyrgos nigripes]|uniref:MAGE domain-containing protein n=1 Tax=Tetrapyrgos nigripes TaxID=182062 RepID=A0A8H5GB72_9AGAR|nr:hypothetical protein D9758_006135 [Tetrapyrgos nigripes]